MFSKKSNLILLFFASALLGAFLPLEERAKAALLPPYGQTLNLQTTAAMTLFEPALAASPAERQISALVFETLFDPRDAEGEFSALAIGAEVLDGGYKLQVKLSPNARFSDGTRIDAEDIEASLLRVLRFARFSAAAYLLTPIEGATEAMNRQTAHLAGFERQSPFEFTLSFTVPMEHFKQILSHPAFGILPARMARQAKPIAMPMGSGAFKVDSRSETEVILVGNEMHHRGRPLLDLIRFFQTDDEAKTFTSNATDAAFYPSAALLQKTGETTSIPSGAGVGFLLGKYRENIEVAKEIFRALFDCSQTVKLFEKRPIRGFDTEEVVLGGGSCVGFSKDIAKARRLIQSSPFKNGFTIAARRDRAALGLIAERIALIAQEAGLPVDFIAIDPLAGETNFDFYLTEASVGLVDIELYRIAAMLAWKRKPSADLDLSLWGTADFTTFFKGNE